MGKARTDSVGENHGVLEIAASVIERALAALDVHLVGREVAHLGHLTARSVVVIHASSRYKR